MSKAGTILRRSGVRLKSLGRSHTSLQILINQLKETRSICKSFTSSQQAANQDLLKWAEQEENRAVKDTVTKISELFVFFTEAQKTFCDSLKDFRNNFEMILEGEKNIDAAKSHVDACQEKEDRLKKEMKRASKRKSGSSDFRELSDKLESAEKEKDLAEVELSERVREHEVVKMIRLKRGLVKWSQAHKELASKSSLIFSAVHDISKLIPDVTSINEVQEIQYTGAPLALQITMDTKSLLQVPASQSSTPNTPNLYPTSELPPPYVEVQPPHNPYLFSSSDTSTFNVSNSVNSSYNRSYSASAVSSLDNSFTPNHNSSFALDPDHVQCRRRSDQPQTSFENKLNRLSLNGND